MKNLKLISLMLCILFPLLASAMKIEKDEIDEFTGLRTVITSWEPVCGNSVCFRFIVGTESKNIATLSNSASYNKIKGICYIFALYY